MDEESARLFTTRAERLPQPDDSDAIRSALEKTVELVPVFGPATTWMLSRFWLPNIDRRREEWLKELADDFDRHCEECKPENLVNNEAFVSASIQAVRIAIGTHLAEKRQYLRNALLKIALGKGPDEVRQQIFFNAIEAFSPAHVKALNAIWRPPGAIRWDEHGIPLGQRTYGAVIEIFATELKGQPSLVAAVITELRNRGFSTLARADYPFPEGGLITNLGIEFLNFVLSPDDLSPTQHATAI